MLVTWEKTFLDHHFHSSRKTDSFSPPASPLSLHVFVFCFMDYWFVCRSFFMPSLSHTQTLKFLYLKIFSLPNSRCINHSFLSPSLIMNFFPPRKHASIGSRNTVPCSLPPLLTPICVWVWVSVWGAWFDCWCRHPVIVWKGKQKNLLLLFLAWVLIAKDFFLLFSPVKEILNDKGNWRFFSQRKKEYQDGMLKRCRRWMYKEMQVSNKRSPKYSHSMSAMGERTWHSSLRPFEWLPRQRPLKHSSNLIYGIVILLLTKYSLQIISQPMLFDPLLLGVRQQSLFSPAWRHA